jgi:hypothetical protein
MTFISYYQPTAFKNTCLHTYEILYLKVLAASIYFMGEIGSSSRSPIPQEEARVEAALGRRKHICLKQLRRRNRHMADHHGYVYFQILKCLILDRKSISMKKEPSSKENLRS